MIVKLGYRWHLRQMMAAHGMFAMTDLFQPLAEHGVRLSSSRVYPLVVERPERLSLKVLMALLDILNCPMDELIETVAAVPAKSPPRRTMGEAVGGLHSSLSHPSAGCRLHPGWTDGPHRR
jgi:Cro/C1-type HTH DNA-binding domain